MSNITIGLAGWGFRQMTIREYFNTAARLGLPRLELNCRPDVPNHAWIDFDQADVAEILACAADSEVQIVALSARNDFTRTEPAQLNSQVAQLRRIIELAAQLKAQFVSVILGPDAEPAKAVLENAVRKLQEAGKFAESLGLKLALENGTGSLRSLDDCLQLMQELSAFPVGMLYNPANFASQGEDPAKALEKLAKHVSYSHLADWDGQVVCPIGKGLIDWPVIIKLLSESPAHLALIEYHNPQDVELGTAASQKKLASLLRSLDRNPNS